jgi:hypothetical protein
MEYETLEHFHLEVPFRLHHKTSLGDYRIQTRHKKSSISKVTVTPISITHKSSNLEFLAFPAAIYSNPVDRIVSDFD